MKNSFIDPKVTIVIPVYNGANYLKYAIESAIAQTYKNTEIIVINDGSTDNGATERIAKSYGDRIRYYKKNNGGVASALNYGIKKMSGSYFSWLSHDDMYEKTKIHDQIDFIRKQQAKDIVIATNAKVLYENGIKKKTNIDKETFRFFDIFLATSALVGINGCTLLIPKEAFDRCGVFDVSLPVTQDYDLWYRLKDKYNFVLLDKHLVISRNHKHQDSVRRDVLMKNAGDQLHHRFIMATPYSRFKDYFRSNKSNITHAYSNYQLYKLRGYNKTASVLLKNILRYYYECDKTKFYTIFEKEIDVKYGDVALLEINGTISNDSNSSKKTYEKHQLIELEYHKLAKAANKPYPLKPFAIAKTPQPSGENSNLYFKIKDSVERDGIVLSLEKTIRIIHRKIKKIY